MSFETPIMRDITKLLALGSIGMLIAFAIIFSYSEVRFQLSSYAEGYSPCDRHGQQYDMRDEEGRLIKSTGTSGAWNMGNWKICNNNTELAFIIGGWVAIGVLTVVNIRLRRKIKNETR